MKLKDVLQKTKDHFSKLGFESSSLDAEVLLSHALGWKRLDLYLKQDYPLHDSEMETCRELVRRRSKGEPVAYILGQKNFYNIDLLVNKHVLIPRPETEHLVDEALAYIKQQNIVAPKILDLGAGSGCIGLSLINEIPEASLVSIEISKEASGLLLENAKRNGLSDRVIIVNKSVEETSLADLGLESESVGFDLLVSNPPYIDREDPDLDANVLAFEPELALFSKDMGLEYYKTWPDVICKSLKAGAMVLFEIGHKQGPSVVDIFKQKNYLHQVSLIKDYSKKDRVVRAVLK